MKIIFFGTPHFVTPILDVLNANYDLVGIVTAPDKKAGRKQLLTPSPVKKYYQEEVYKTGKNPDETVILTPENFSVLNSLPRENLAKWGQLSTLKSDLFVVAAYGKILPKEVLEIPPFGTICIHPSLLPKYRGPSPIPQTLLDGEKITGTTIYKMDEKIDHGPVLSTKTFEIHDTDTNETLTDHLFNLGAEMLPDVINNYTAGKIVPETQDDSLATYTKLLTKQNGFIDLDNPPDPAKFRRMLRAYYPWPGVWTKVRIKNIDLRFKILPNDMIQVEGKKPVSYKDFVNGYSMSDNKLINLLTS